MRAPKATIKLVSAKNPGSDIPGSDNPGSNPQLRQWEEAARLSHPHLIRLFEYGRCQLEDTTLLYVVMDYADENLSEIIPLRALSHNEVFEMLRPTAEGLAFLHRAGFVHGSLKPSNVMAVDNQLKISSDKLHKSGECSDHAVPKPYDAPELTRDGFAPASDVWSLGMTLAAVLTQIQPKNKDVVQQHVTVPGTIPQPLRGIVQRCLQLDPAKRCTVNDIVQQLSTPSSRATSSSREEGAVGTRADERHIPENRPKRWVLVPILVVALILLLWIGNKFMVHHATVPASETPAASSQSGDVPPGQSPAPFSAGEKGGRGTVLKQVMPEVSRNALNTISGRLKVGVQVAVDSSGNVSEARLVSPGPSKYFASRALNASRQWTFTPPQQDGHATASVWLLHFQFRRASVQVFPAETKP